MTEFSALVALVIGGLFSSLIVLIVAIHISSIFRRLLAIIGYVAEPMD